VLHLPVGVSVAVRDLLAATGTPQASTPEPATTAFVPCASTVVAPPVTAAVGGTSLYEVCLAAASGLCGQAEVLGRLCDDGCTTASDRPYVVDGVRLLLRPLESELVTFLADLDINGVTSAAHLRSQVAAAYFARERATAGSLLSAAGIAGAVWSAGATPVAETVVPIGVLGWTGSTIVLLDTWTARRELIDAAADRYWAGRIGRRPWSVFLAQVLQFQSQLTAPAPAVPNPAVPPRILLERGFVQLPSAGYLGGIDLKRDLREQVQDLMGPGVALRFCAVPADQIPRELERAQHLERISLLRAAQGRDPEQVDVLVPDGKVVVVAPEPTGLGFAVDARVGAEPLTEKGSPQPLIGAARRDEAKAIDVRVAVAGTAAQGMPPLVVGLARAFVGSPQDVDDLARRRPRPTEPNLGLLRDLGDAALAAGVRRRAGASATSVESAAPRALGQAVAAWATLSVDDDPFALAVGAESRVEAALDLTVPGEGAPTLAARILGAVLRRLAGGTGDSAREALVELTGVLRVDGMSLGGTPFGEPGDRVLTVRMVLHRGLADGHTWFAVTDESRTVVAAVAWAGSPLLAQGAFAHRARGSENPDLAPLVAALTAADVYAALAGLTDWQALLAFTARADDTLARTRGQHYQAATAALAVLATDTHPDDPRYVADRHALLFPPEDDAVVSEVTPTTEWVLFRRRTRKECEGGPGVGPPGAGPVTVWVREEQNAEAADALVQKLKADDWPPVEEWNQAEVVFAPDRTDLLTPEVTWRARYQDAGGGPHVRYAAYAADTPTQANIVGPDRVEALLDTLPPVATRDSGVEADLDVDPPEAYLPQRTEGSTFLVTYADVETPEPVLAVVAVDRNAATGAVQTAIDHGDAAVVANALTTFVRPGEVTPQDQDLDSVVNELRVAFPTPPVAGARAMLWIRPGLSIDDRDALVVLAGRMATAAAPVMGSADIAVPPPIEVVPPAGLPDATLFLVVVTAN
jgi:hypothetical protein